MDGANLESGPGIEVRSPRRWGKGLQGERSQEWSYRIGKYRILADIVDDQVIIEVFKIGLRDKVYIGVPYNRCATIIIDCPRGKDPHVTRGLYEQVVRTYP